MMLDIPARFRDRLDTLEEENRQLRERIADLTGRHEIVEAKVAFGLTESQARTLVLLVNRSRADKRQIEDCIYDGRCLAPDNPGDALRIQVNRLRRKVAAAGVSIGTVYGTGYSMDEAACAKVRKIIRGVPVC